MSLSKQALVFLILLAELLFPKILAGPKKAKFQGSSIDELIAFIKQEKITTSTQLAERMPDVVKDSAVLMVGGRSSQPGSFEFPRVLLPFSSHTDAKTEYDYEKSIKTDGIVMTVGLAGDPSKKATYNVLEVMEFNKATKQYTFREIPLARAARQKPHDPQFCAGCHASEDPEKKAAKPIWDANVTTWPEAIGGRPRPSDESDWRPQLDGFYKRNIKKGIYKALGLKPTRETNLWVGNNRTFTEGLSVTHTEFLAHQLATLKNASAFLRPLAAAISPYVNNDQLAAEIAQSSQLNGKKLDQYGINKLAWSIRDTANNDVAGFRRYMGMLNTEGGKFGMVHANDFSGVSYTDSVRTAARLKVVLDAMGAPNFLDKLSMTLDPERMLLPGNPAMTRQDMFRYSMSGDQDSLFLGMCQKAIQTLVRRSAPDFDYRSIETIAAVKNSLPNAAELPTTCGVDLTGLADH